MLMKRTSISVVIFLLSVFLINESTAFQIKTELKDVNTTKKPDDSEDKLPMWTGYLGCIIASIFFGSNLLPVKQFSAGDGVFFQFVYCVAVWAVGLIVDLVLKNERFYPLVLVGGKTIRLINSTRNFLIFTWFFFFFRSFMDDRKYVYRILYSNLWSFRWFVNLGYDEFSNGLGWWSLWDLWFNATSSVN